VAAERQLEAASQKPVPCSAATMGLGDASKASITSRSDGGAMGLPNSVMSAPAEKVRPRR
jgi:hypothetical protein